MFVIIIMLLALLSNSSPNLSEDECDLLYGQGCICNMSQVLLDIESILQSPVGIKFANEVMSDVSIRIVQYKCSAFKPLPRGFDITLLTTPSRVEGMLNDTDKLSMSSEQFNKAIFEYTLIENANVVYAFPGSDYRFSCIVGSKEFLKDIVDSVNYVWNFNKKTNLTTSDERVTVHKRNGDLTISDLEPNDQGTYYCTISYSNDNAEEIVEQEYKHALEVITIPQYSIVSTVHYHTHNTECKEEILELIELYVPTLLHDILCRLDSGDAGSICKVTAGNPVCQTVENLKQVSISVHLDLIQSPFQFPSLRSASGCNPICQQKIYAKLVVLLERNLRKALKLPIFANSTFIMSDLLPNHKKLRTKISIGCKAGYYFLDSYCAPCPPNHYSLEGSATCLKCKLGYYQPNYGSKNCKPSFKGVQNIKLMNLSTNWNWKTIDVIVVAIVLLNAICCFIQQVMILFMPLRMAFKCIGLVFTLCKAAIKLTWSLITKSIYTVFITLTACFRLLYWRKSKRKSNSPEKNGEKKPNVETSEDETESLIPDSRNARIVKFDKKSKTGRNKKGLNKFKMKAKKSNTKSKLQKFAGFMKKVDRKQGIPKVRADENRDSSSSSRFSDSSNMSFMNPPSVAPPYRPQKQQPGNRNEPIPDQPLEVNSYHSAMSAPQKTLLKDVLLMSENEDAPPQETNRSKAPRPNDLDFIHLHTKLRKK